MAKEIVQAEEFSVSEHCTPILKISQKPVMALNLCPNQFPKTFPEILGEDRFHGHGPSHWAQAIGVKSWPHGQPGTLPYGIILALGGSSNPHRP
ncbi:hypothetical protein O181_015398 [Austropuccinia psidii MF-1]|uniref:Uncharacterized protein n=1 Tax=Austropuccinia psidii MF-1 TaxID=1389203 RepID=A0A9Q3C2E4_9BASI|nr:hypothetical protein [Austropuccinia psidii MF-1]